MYTKCLWKLFAITCLLFSMLKILLRPLKSSSIEIYQKTTKKIETSYQRWTVAVKSFQFIITEEVGE